MHQAGRAQVGFGDGGDDEAESYQPVDRKVISLQQLGHFSPADDAYEEHSQQPGDAAQIQQHENQGY